MGKQQKAEVIDMLINRRKKKEMAKMTKMVKTGMGIAAGAPIGCFLGAITVPLDMVTDLFAPISYPAKTFLMLQLAEKLGDVKIDNITKGAAMMGSFVSSVTAPVHFCTRFWVSPLAGFITGGIIGGAIMHDNG